MSVPKTLTCRETYLLGWLTGKVYATADMQPEGELSEMSRYPVMELYRAAETAKLSGRLPQQLENFVRDCFRSLALPEGTVEKAGKEARRSWEDGMHAAAEGLLPPPGHDIRALRRSRSIPALQMAEAMGVSEVRLRSLERAPESVDEDMWQKALRAAGRFRT